MRNKSINKIKIAFMFIFLFTLHSDMSWYTKKFVFASTQNTIQSELRYYNDYNGPILHVVGMIIFSGTAESSNFSRYTLEIANTDKTFDINSSSYRQLTLSFRPNPQDNSILAFDTRRIMDGYYVARLRVFDTSGAFQDSFVRFVVVNYSYPYEYDYGYYFFDAPFTVTVPINDDGLPHIIRIKLPRPGFRYVLSFFSTSSDITAEFTSYPDSVTYYIPLENSAEVFTPFSSNTPDVTVRVQSREPYLPSMPEYYTVSLTEYTGTVPPTPTVQPTPIPGLALTPQPVTCDAADSYEGDNTLQQAKPITPDAAVQQHNFGCGSPDEDWLKLDVLANQTYYWQIKNVSSAADPTLELTDATGAVINANYGYYPGIGYLTAWTAPTDQTIYVRIKNWSGVLNTRNSYSVGVLTDAAIHKLYLPITSHELAAP